MVFSSPQELLCASSSPSPLYFDNLGSNTQIPDILNSDLYQEGRGMNTIEPFSQDTLRLDSLAPGSRGRKPRTGPAAIADPSKTTVCTVCQATFSGSKRNYLLNRHMVIHTGEKPFHCPHCMHRTNRKENLTLHILCRHRTDPTIQSDIN